MLYLFSSFVMVLTFLLSGISFTRVFPIIMITEGYTSYEVSMINIARIFGNFFALLYFKNTFIRFGYFRFLVIGVMILTQCFLLAFSLTSLYIYVPVFFLFGYFDKCCSFLVKPILKNFFSNYQKQFEIIVINFTRFLSGFLIILKKEYLLISVILCITTTLIIYTFNESRNVSIKNDFMKSGKTQMLFVYTNYNDYFVSSFCQNFSSTLITSYLFLFLRSMELMSTTTYMSLYLWGQFVYSYIFSKFLQSLNLKHRVFATTLIIIIISSCVFYVFAFDVSWIYYKNIDVVKGFVISLLGGAFSNSFKTYFQAIKHPEHQVSIDLIEDQIGGVASIFAVLIGLVLLQVKYKSIFFLFVVVINIFSLVNNYFASIFKNSHINNIKN